MQAKAFMAAVAVAVCMTVPSLAAPPSQTTAPHIKRKQVEAKKPTWEECYAMSRQRGFDHDFEEWWQAIKDCQEGKIPL